MDDNYRVIGIMQSCINGQWSERAVSADVYAVDRGHAEEKVLGLYTTAARQVDPLAIVRWHTPQRVRVYSI
jgi:hypothetical protein